MLSISKWRSTYRFEEASPQPVASSAPLPETLPFSAHHPISGAPLIANKLRIDEIRLPTASATLRLQQ